MKKRINPMASDSRGTTAVSLLITPTTISAVQVQASSGGMKVLVRGSIETPAGTVDGAFVQAPGRLARAIKSLWSSLNLRTRTVTVALASTDYSLRALRLPEAPPREQRALVRGELEQIMALPIGGGGYDFIWLPADTQGAPAEVTAYYVSDAVVDSIRDALQRAGLSMAGIEPCSLGLMRAYLASRPTKQTVALLYPAEKYSDLCFHDGVKVRHIRRIPAGWGDMAQEVISKTNSEPISLNDRIVQEEAAPDKTLSLLTDWQDEPGISEQQPSTPQPIHSRSAAEMDTSSKGTFLAAEVVRSLAFFAREYGEDVRPASIVIIGSEKIANDIKRALSPVQSIPIVFTDPLADIDYARSIALQAVDSSPSDYASAIGAALGAMGLENGLPVIDVSQQEESARTRRLAPIALLAGMAGSTIWMVLAAIASITLTVLESNAQSESGKLAAKIIQTRKDQEPALWYQQTYTAAKAEQTKSQIPAGSVLGRVANSYTAGISLKSLGVSHDGKVTIGGNANSVTDLQNFALAIGKGKSVRAAVIQAMHQEPKGSLTFTILGNFPKVEAPPETTDKTVKKE